WGVSSPQWAAILRDREGQVFLVSTLVIGALVGLAVVAFILLTERFGNKLYPAAGMGLRRLLVPVGGSLGMGYLLYRYFPDARGSGVPQTKAALYAREGNISFGTVIGKFFCTSATLASGIPLGREGPAAQVGAGIASVLGRWLGLRTEKVKALLPVGATAAIAAAFNTPLAAVLFWLEGVVVGTMGWFVPQLLGVGYDHVGEALNGAMALKLMALLLVLKLVAVAVSYASGNAGGIFGPSLFLGAMLGGVVGNVANHFFPHTVGTPAAYALVGMGTAFAGIVRAPMTSVLMIFEITRDYAVIVPLMISNLVSFFISARLQRNPIYDELAHQDGIHLPAAQTRKQETQRQVNHAMREATEVLPPDSTVHEALERARASAFKAWPVGDSGGVIGVVGLQ